MIEMLIVLVIVGAVLYVLSVVPIDATLKMIARVIIIVFVCIWLLRLLGRSGGLPF